MLVSLQLLLKKCGMRYKKYRDMKVQVLKKKIKKRPMKVLEKKREKNKR